MAVSDVNMSSEGSGSSSRLRQFGLYKNIDSRTAEFLKLSRKRQIRRGCACAAVSTAITVTVVVSALLVYEYGFHTESKVAPNTLRKFNWFNAVNGSEVTFDRNKDPPASNIDSNKLLPIILKALDQKRYLETLIEEQSTTPSYEKTTEYALEKNLFTDARNWKGSQLKLGEIGYKGPPRGFYRQKHTDTFFNARKLIDYQRIMTYLNSMSINTKVEEPNQDQVSSTWKPSSSTDSFNLDFLYQYSYRKADLETKTQELTQTTVAPKKNERMIDESEKKYCQCANKSNLSDILKKLYDSIQQLGPRIFGKPPNRTGISNGRNSENYTSVIVQQPNIVSNQRVPAYGNLNNTAIPSKRKKISFFRLGNKTITFKPQMESLLSEIPTSNTNKTNNLVNKQSNISVVQNDYYMPHKDRANRLKADAIPWWLSGDGKTTSEAPASVYMYTDKTVNITSNLKPSVKTNRQTKESTTTSKENTAAAKEAPSNQGYLNEDEEHDFDDEIDNILPESNQDLNPNPTRINKGKGKLFEEYNYLANYMDGLNNLYSKTIIMDKPRTASPVKNPKMKPFDLKQFFSYETVDPLEKVQKTTTDMPRTFKPIQLFSEKQRLRSNKMPPSQPVENSGKNRKNGFVHTPKTAKPYYRSKLEETEAEIKQPKGNALLPMIQSYLLSKDDNGVLNLKFDTTTSMNKLSIKGSEELPFDLNLYSNERNDHIYANIINNFHTTTSTTLVPPLDKGKFQLWKIAEHKSTERTQVKLAKKKKGSKRRKLPKVQMLTQAEPTEQYPKTFTYKPVKTEPKNHKVKELFYMTGSEAPPDDFDANLHELIYYFDRSPVNYTALTNAFLNNTVSGSLEISQSMMPETRPSYLEIRRSHNGFDTHMYD